jgi:drug/metabolite transporter (DMT)-like permease
MTLAMLSFAAGNVYDQAATQNINRPGALAAAAIQSIPIFLYALVLYLLVIVPARRRVIVVGTSEIKQRHNYGRWQFALAGILTQLGTAAFFQALIVSGFQGLNITLPFVQTWELMAIIMGVLFLKERPTVHLYIGMVVMVLGLAGVAIATHSQEDPFKSPDWFWAIPLGLIAAFCWASSAILAKAGMRRGVSPFGGLTIQYFAGFWAAFILMWFLGNGKFQILSIEQIGQSFNLSGQVWLYLLGGAIINGILATGFLTFALRVAPAYKVLPINAVYPALAVLLGWLFLGDRNRPDLWAFLALLVVAVGLIYTQVGPNLFKRQEHPGIGRH